MLWKTSDNGQYDIPTETCDVHTKKQIKIPSVVGKTKEEAINKLDGIKDKEVEDVFIASF